MGYSIISDICCLSSEIPNQCVTIRTYKVIDVNIIRKLAKSVEADKITVGIMITSSYFSPDTKDFSNNLKHRLSLIDYIKLRGSFDKI
jgi:restriction endonuclease Mrr